jgi:hypothetical protein
VPSTPLILRFLKRMNVRQAFCSFAVAASKAAMASRATLLSWCNRTTAVANLAMFGDGPGARFVQTVAQVAVFDYGYARA